MVNILTVEEGLKIQAEQLEQWAIVLKPEIHSELVAACNQHKEANKYADGYAVPRGVSLDSAVQNFMLGWRPMKIR